MSSATMMGCMIAGVFLLLAAGWLARRTGILAAAALPSCSRFTLDVALPCLIYTKILETVSREDLARDWSVPLAGVGIVILGELAARAGAGRGPAPDQRATFVIAAGVPNWLYLALAVLEPVWGRDAVRTLLLTNVGVHAYLWTFGVAAFLPAGEPVAARFRRIAANPALWATALGLATVAAYPSAAEWVGGLRRAAAAGSDGPAPGLAALAAYALVDALSMMGAVAIPLNLALVGAQLADLPAPRRGGKRLLARVVVLRLAAAPALTGAALVGLAAAGWPVGGNVVLTLWLMAAMPTAVVCSLVTEAYGGDTPLAARAIAATTAASLATLPLWTLAAPRLYAWAMG